VDTKNNANPYNFELHRFKFGALFETQCRSVHTSLSPHHQYEV